MKEQDVRYGMKVRMSGIEDPCIVINDKGFTSIYGKVYTVQRIKTGEKINLNACDFEPYIDIPETADALNRAFNNLAETLTKTLQPLIEWISRPEVAKALEALAKESVKEKTLREEISNAFEEFCVSGAPYSSFTIFEAGYHAGMKRGDK